MSKFKFQKNKNTNCLIYFLLIIFVSCGSKKNLVYYQNSNEKEIKNLNSNFEPKLKSDDLLRIFVNTKDVEASIPFNLPTIANVSTGRGATGQIEYQNYLVDNKGFIDFPVIGKIKVGGLTKTEFIKNLKEEFKKYLKLEPLINVAILNFKIAVTGEVMKPGNFNIISERISLPEALALAGDLTIYGKRNNIIVLRDIEGVKTINKVDITNVEFINSEFYYLTQNDVIYVEPNKTKINASVIGPNASVIISGLSLLITITALLIR